MIGSMRHGFSRGLYVEKALLAGHLSSRALGRQSYTGRPDNRIRRLAKVLFRRSDGRLPLRLVRPGSRLLLLKP